MTSNLGARFIQKRATLGFQTSADSSREKMEDQVMSEVKKTFAPEFINRLDEIIIFDELVEADLRQIVDLQIGKLNEILEKRTLQIRLAEEAQNWLIEKTCADRSYGARPLKRALQKYVEDELSEALIQGEISEESIIEVFCENDKLAFRAIRLEELEKEFFEKSI
jgi:ATP-dependent Clp protease ATP-binding subunit ClpC